MIPGIHYTEKGGFKMKPFYMGIDVSKGYGDFMILNSKKQPSFNSHFGGPISNPDSPNRRSSIG